MEENKKYDVKDVKKENKSFWIKAKNSIFNFDRYNEFLDDKVGTTIKYIFQMMLIFALIVTIITSYKFITNLKKAEKTIKEEFKEYSFKDGILSVDTDNDKIDLDKDMKLLVNTNIDSKISENKNVQSIESKANADVNVEENQTIADEKYTIATENEIKNNENTIEEKNKADAYIDELNKYNKGILLLKDKVILKDIVYSGLTELDYSNVVQRYKIQNFNKLEFEQFYDENYSKVVFSIAGMIFIVDFIIYLIQLLLDILLLTILAYIISKIVRVKLNTKACFNISVHALTLPVLLNLIYIIVNSFTGLTIDNFRWMYTTISYIYIIVAILMIKTDIITIQKQLIKIKTEEEKVKEELEAKKEEEKEEQEKKDVEKKDKEQEKKQKKDKEKKEPAAEGALFEKTDE